MARTRAAEKPQPVETPSSDGPKRSKASNEDERSSARKSKTPVSLKRASTAPRTFAIRNAKTSPVRRSLRKLQSEPPGPPSQPRPNEPVSPAEELEANGEVGEENDGGGKEDGEDQENEEVGKDGRNGSAEGNSEDPGLAISEPTDGSSQGDTPGDEPPTVNRLQESAEEHIQLGDDPVDIDPPAIVANHTTPEPEVEQVDDAEAMIDNEPAHSAPMDRPADLPLGPKYVPSLTLEGHTAPVSMCKFSPDLNYLSTCSADHSVRIWKLPDFQLVRTLYGHLAGVSAVAWSPCSTLLASGSDDKTIRFWHVRDFRPHRTTLAEHHSYVSCLAFSPRGNMLASGSYDESLIIWSVRSLIPLMTLPAHSDPISSVSFSLDGTLLCSAGGDGLIRLWDPSTGQCLRTLIHEDNAPVVNVTFSPNGRYLFAQSLDSYGRLWDYARGKGEIVKTYQGHQNSKSFAGAVFGTYQVSKEDVSDRRAMVLSTSEDGSVFIWDVISKKPLQVIKDAHQSSVFGVDWVEDQQGCRMFVSCGADGLVKVWKEDMT